MLPELIEYIKKTNLKGPCSLEKLQQLFLPLLEEVASLHDKGLVKGQLKNKISVQNEILILDDNSIPADLILSEKESKTTHSCKDDIYEIGLIFSSLALAIPLYETTNNKLSYDEVLSNQEKIKQYNPVIIELINSINHLDEKKRLSNCREFQYKLEFANQLQTKILNEFEVLKTLQLKLYDYSKKSKTLFSQESNKKIALTQIENFETIFNKFHQNNSIALNLNGSNPNIKAFYQKLRFIHLESLNDIKNRGISNLKIALVNLHWNDPNNKAVSIKNSPLFFIPVKLIFDKKNTEQIKIELLSDELEINPALSFFFKHHFNIQLPDKLRIEDYESSNIFKILNQSSASSNIPIQWKKASENLEAWSVNFEHIVLGNFTYKKSSLTRDYSKIIEDKRSSSLVQSLIGNEEIKSLKKLDYSPEIFYTIAVSDPYQDQAIIQARKGVSFAIQGPPGTGKSQTISNVIADFVARDKKVLLVSSKKAALNSVYQKFKKADIHNCCSIIHDAQTDKIDFIHELQKEYNNRIDNVYNFEKIESKRKLLSNEILQQTTLLSNYQNVLKKTLVNCKTTCLNHLYKSSLKKEVKHQTPNLQQDDFSLWENYGQHYSEIYNHFKTTDLTLPISAHAFSILSDDTWHKLQKENTLEKDLLTIKAHSEASYKNILEIPEQYLKGANIVAIDNYWQEIQVITAFQKKNDVLLLSNNSPSFIDLLKAKKEKTSLKKKLESVKNANEKWKVKPETAIVNNHLQVLKNELHRFPILKSSYRDVILDLIGKIKFPFIPTKSNLIELLELLQKEYSIEEEIYQLDQSNQKVFGTEKIEAYQEKIKAFSEQISPPILNHFINNLTKDSFLSNTFDFIQNWQQTRDSFDYFEFSKRDSFTSYIKTISKLLMDVETPFHIASNIVKINENNEAKKLFFQTSFSPKSIQNNLAINAIKSEEQNNPKFSNYKQDFVQKNLNDLSKKINEFHSLNQGYIKAKQSNYFHKKIRLSTLSISGLNDAKKEDRKNLVEGVKILEKEFSKSRNIKSIRDLNESLAQSIIMDLKPVWLMSPLSVSEIFPLQKDLFDLIIFDESSQIEIEDVVPTFYRTKQCIIVGDTMQMPPSTFFKKSMDNSDTTKSTESILHYAEKKWPQLELRWHYRSKNDDLISFNNSAFYENKLNTIPSRKIRNNTNSYVDIKSIQQAAFTYESIRENTLNFHYVHDGIFENRKNKKEAAYIAELVKHFLLSKKPLNLGIIALSHEQEIEIKNAIKGISYFDKNFKELLQDKKSEQEYFQELFIKNVENIQGEERDLILISIGYGHDKNGQFSNNFGPINHLGGERRLNVLFSRAKQNLLLVSSIKYQDIMNSSNTGVNCLKNYLEFAEKYSLGIAINKLKFEKNLLAKKTITSSIDQAFIQSIKTAIEAKGYFVEEYIGHSNFQIPLGVKRKKSSNKFILGILIDDDEFYNSPAHFSFSEREKILQSFSWKTTTVISKNWLEEKESILQNILELLEKPVKEKVEKVKNKTTKESEFQLAIKDLLFTRLETREEPKKFWQIAGKIDDLVIQYGKVGKKGKTLIKNLDNVAAVIIKKRNLIKQKEKKGYRRV